MLIKTIKNISQLNIDADKDWNARGISNINAIAANMSVGNLVQSNGVVLVRIANGPTGYVLTSAGPGKLLTWAPAGGALKYYFPAIISSTKQLAIKSVSKSITKTGLISTSHGEDYQTNLPLYILRTDAAVSSSNTQSIVAASATISKNARAKAALAILCDGFVEEPAGGPQTDKTSQARDATANDLNLNPMTPAINDKIYIGSNYPFWQVWMQLGTQGIGSWTNQWYYWNGAWVSVVDEIDGSNEWQTAAGLKSITHTPQGDWVTTNILGMNLYWLKCETTNFINQTTAPKGSQVWVAINV